MESNIYLSRQRGDETNHILVRGYQTCSSGYPDVRHYGNFEDLSRPYTPLRDITGSIFGGIARESGVRAVNEPNHFNRIRNSMIERSHGENIRDSESRFFGFGSNNRNTAYNHHANDIRAFNRSMSMSSPNIDVGIASEFRNSFRDAIENNSSFMNRSRSFADRIMEQFDIVEREHNQLAERIHRSQSIYEQIQRNGAEIEQLFDNLSHRMQRRHTQRESSGGYNLRFRNARDRGSMIECDRSSHTTNHRFSNRPRFVSMEDIHNHFRDHLMGTEEEQEEEDNDVIEIIQVDDDEISDIISRRNADIRNRSLIITQEEIIMEESNESENSLDEHTIHNIHEREHNHDHEYEQDLEHEEIYDNDDNGNITRVLNRLRDRISQNQEEEEEVLGVPISIQNALPVSKFDLSRSQNLDDDKKMCLICLDEFKDQQEILWLPCTHCFCRKCITSWFERGTACPICKDDLLAHFKY